MLEISAKHCNRWVPHLNLVPFSLPYFSSSSCSRHHLCGSVAGILVVADDHRRLAVVCGSHTIDAAPHTTDVAPGAARRCDLPWPHGALPHHCVCGVVAPLALPCPCTAHRRPPHHHLAGDEGGGQYTIQHFNFNVSWLYLSCVNILFVQIQYSNIQCWIRYTKRLNMIAPNIASVLPIYCKNLGCLHHIIS